jgi:hypothetical protein
MLETIILTIVSQFTNHFVDRLMLFNIKGMNPFYIVRGIYSNFEVRYIYCYLLNLLSKLFSKLDRDIDNHTTFETLLAGAWNARLVGHLQLLCMEM